MRRAYFLYLSRTKSVIELDKSDVRTVLDYCSQQIRQNLIVQSKMQAYVREL